MDITTATPEQLVKLYNTKNRLLRSPKHTDAYKGRVATEMHAIMVVLISRMQDGNEIRHVGINGDIEFRA